MKELKGAVVATVTPFTPGGERVDPDWISQHLAFLDQHGIDGVIPLGTNGEGPSVSLEEKRRVVDAVMMGRGSLFVVVGTGCSALPDTIAISRYALERGADAVIIIPPFYFKNISQRGLWDYYRSVFQALPPEGKVLLYNIPSLSGVEISDELIDALLREYPSHLVGVKDTSGVVEKTSHYIRRYPQLRIFVGSDELVTAALRAGAAGSVSAVANFFPQLVAAVYRAHSGGGDVEAAQAKLSKARALLRKHRNSNATKLLIHKLTGFPLIGIRPPFAELNAAEMAELERDLEAMLPLVM